MAVGFTVARFLRQRGQVDKCAAVTYLWNEDLHIIVRLSQTMRLRIL